MNITHKGKTISHTNPLEVEVTGSNVKDYWTIAGVKNFGSSRTGLVISNDGGSDITLTINSMTIIIKQNEVFDEKFDSFSTLTIATSSTFRAWARG